MTSDYYYPGYKGGGPIRTLVNQIEHLGSEFSYKVLTRDRDLGDEAPYPEVERGGCAVGPAQVHYLEAGELSFLALREKINATGHDILYLNSFFSPVFTVKILLLKRLGLIRQVPVVLAPRGEFSAGAIALKSVKKRVYIWLAKAAGLYRKVIWQASSSYEKQDIQRRFGDTADVHIAPDMAPKLACLPEPPLRRVKVRNKISIVFLSRISPMKNLDGLLNILHAVTNDVLLNIYGPIEDQDYWSRCETLIEGLPGNIHVEYKGSVPYTKVPAVFAEHDLFFFPTRGENYGHVILEALTAGCPVLLSDQTPWRDLHAKGVGWDIPLDQIDSFVRVIEECCAMSDDILKAYSQRARDFALQFYQDDEVATANRRLFQVALQSVSA